MKAPRVFDPPAVLSSSAIAAARRLDEVREKIGTDFIEAAARAAYQGPLLQTTMDRAERHPSFMQLFDVIGERPDFPQSSGTTLSVFRFLDEGLDVQRRLLRTI